MSRPAAQAAEESPPLWRRASIVIWWVLMAWFAVQSVSDHDWVLGSTVLTWGLAGLILAAAVASAVTFARDRG